jgi:hypothetical protein
MGAFDIDCNKEKLSSKTWLALTVESFTILHVFKLTEAKPDLNMSGREGADLV